MAALLAREKANFSSLTLNAIEAALLAGEILKQGFGSHFKISSKKGRHNLVTEYDHESERAILSFLKKNVPNSHFLSEEGGNIGDTSNSIYWIIDPLDGTVNFAHRIPIFSVSIAALQGDKIVSGVIFQPITQELFVAQTGAGAFLNGSQIQVSKTSSMEKAILATGFPYDLAENPSHCIEHFVDVLKLGVPVRRMGSAAIDLAYSAAGRFDAFFEVSLSPWDIAAGKLILEEAGGMLTHWDGSSMDIHSEKSVLASNGNLHEEMLLLLKKRPSN